MYSSQGSIVAGRVVAEAGPVNPSVFLDSDKSYDFPILKEP